MTSEGVGARKGIGFGGNWGRMGYAKEFFFFLRVEFGCFAG